MIELALKLKQKWEKIEKQKENSAKVDAILIRLMKKVSHLPLVSFPIFFFLILYILYTYIACT
jgi:hypothetical protein